jgi:hypothetical protein
MDERRESATTTTTTTTISSREGEIGCRRRLRAADVSFFEYELVAYAYTQDVSCSCSIARPTAGCSNERTKERTVLTEGSR